MRMLSSTRDLLTQAMRDGYGVLAFNVIGLEHAEAIVRGAELERSPVILQISQNAIRYRFDRLEPLSMACLELGRTSSVPIALHLDHATTSEICERAQAVGYSSIMFDASTADHDHNIRETARQVTWAHAHGLSIEGEIGIVGGKDGVTNSDEGMTDPDAAVDYVAQTGVDALAVAIGTVHGMTHRDATIDLDRLSRIRSAVPRSVPLVLHGSSGVADADLVGAVRAGITKINVATQLNVAYTGAVRDLLTKRPELVDPRGYGEVGRAAMIEVVRDRCRLVGSAGHA